MPSLNAEGSLWPEVRWNPRLALVLVSAVDLDAPEKRMKELGTKLLRAADAVIGWLSVLSSGGWRAPPRCFCFWRFMRKRRRASNSAKPPRLPITLPTTFGVLRGPPLSESSLAVAAVVAAGAGAVLAGPPPTAEVYCAALDEVSEVTEVDEDRVDEVEDRDEDDDEVEVRLKDEKIDNDSELDVLVMVELKLSVEGKIVVSTELGAAVDIVDEMTTCELGAASTTVTVETPDGRGYAGTVKSLGNAGTEGTEGSRAVGTASTTGIEGVTVSRPTMFPLASTIATTSTATVNIFGEFCAARRWNMRCAVPMTGRPSVSELAVAC